MPRFSDPKPLGPDHLLEDFSCGEASLDIWIQNHARQAALQDTARTYVVCDAEQGERVVGYHAITGASISPEDATKKVGRGLPRLEIPAVLLARLAVDRSVEKKGLGAWLLQDAMKRSAAAAETVGMRLMLVHALNHDAKAFYEHFGFQPSPTDPLNLQMKMKDLRASLAAAR